MSELSKQCRFMADLCPCQAADKRCDNCQILLRAAEQIQWLQAENKRLWKDLRSGRWDAGMRCHSGVFGQRREVSDE